jgi:hypothetical protein
MSAENKDLVDLWNAFSTESAALGYRGHVLLGVSRVCDSLLITVGFASRAELDACLAGRRDTTFQGSRIHAYQAWPDPEDNGSVCGSLSEVDRHALEVAIAHSVENQCDVLRLASLVVGKGCTRFAVSSEIPYRVALHALVKWCAGQNSPAVWKSLITAARFCHPANEQLLEAERRLQRLYVTGKRGRTSVLKPAGLLLSRFVSAFSRAYSHSSAKRLMQMVNQPSADLDCMPVDQACFAVFCKALDEGWLDRLVHLAIQFRFEHLLLQRVRDEMAKEGLLAATVSQSRSIAPWKWRDRGMLLPYESVRHAESLRGLVPSVAAARLLFLELFDSPVDQVEDEFGVDEDYLPTLLKMAERTWRYGRLFEKLLIRFPDDLVLRQLIQRFEDFGVIELNR